MATETLRPNAAGTYTEWTASAGSNYACVDEDPASDTDYVRTSSTVDLQTDSYNLPTPSSITGTINSVTLYIRVKKTSTSTSNVCSPFWTDGAFEQDGSNLTLTTSFQLLSQSLPTRPDGGAWTASDFTNLEIGMRGKNATSQQVQVSQIYLVVDYTDAPVAPTLASPANNAVLWTAFPILTLNNVAGGTSYDFQIATDNGFSNIYSQTTQLTAGGGGQTTWTGALSSGCVPASGYYWRARAYNGSAYSTYSTTSGFTIGMFPAPSGMLCDFNAGIVEANGYPNFMGYFVGSGTGGNATSVQFAFVQSGAGKAVSYDSPLIISSWISGLNVVSGTRSPQVVYSGALGSFYNTGFSGLFWAMRFKNASGVYSYWGSGLNNYLWTGVRYPGQMMKSTIVYQDEGNQDPPLGPGPVYSGRCDAFDYIPWDNVVGIRRVHLRCRPIENFSVADFAVTWQSGLPSSFVSAGWLSCTMSQDLNLFPQSGVWYDVFLSGSAGNVNPVTSGMSYVVHWYDGDTPLGNPSGIQVELQSVEFLLSGYQGFYINRNIWPDTARSARHKVNFGYTHNVIPSGYTAEVTTDTGGVQIVATNAVFNEGMPDSLSNVIYHKGKTHIIYLANADVGDDDYTIYLVSKDWSTGLWGTPSKVDIAYTTSDTHHAPSICVDKNDKLHVFYGTHSNYGTQERLKHKISSGVNTGDQGWTAVQTISDAGPCTYHYPFVKEDGSIYVIYRSNYGSPYGGGGDNGNDLVGYIVSTDHGQTWATPRYFSWNDLGYNNYAFGLHYDRNTDRLYVAFSYTDVNNRSLGVWYAQSDDMLVWMTPSGTVAGYTVTGLPNYSTSPIMRQSGTYQGSHVHMADSLISRFCRPLTIDNSGGIHVFYTSDRFVDSLAYVDTFAAPDDARYTYGSINHAYYNSGWQKTNISELLDWGVWNARMGVRPVVSEDNTLHLFSVEKALQDFSFTATASGTPAHSYDVVGDTTSFNCVNDSRDSLDINAYVSLSGANTGSIFFSGTSQYNLSGYNISAVYIESIVKNQYPNSMDMCHMLRRDGVNFSGAPRPCYNRITGYESYAPVCMVDKWFLDPKTNLPWTYSGIVNLEWGVNKLTASGELRLYDTLLRVQAIKAATTGYYSGEVVEFVSQDKGATWKKRYLTNYSAYGAPMLAIKNEFSNGRLELCWSAGYNIHYYDVDPRSYFNFDGTDVAVTYNGQVIDRVVGNTWNNDQSLIKFKIQADIASGAPYGPSDYYVHFVDKDTTIVADNPYNVFQYYESFENWPWLDAGYETIYPRSMTRSGITYSATNSNVSEAADGLVESTVTGVNYIQVYLDVRCVNVASQSLDAAVAVRVSNSGQWNQNSVLATGTNTAIPLPLVSAGWQAVSTPFTMTGVTYSSGMSIKVDYYSLPIGTGSHGEFRINRVVYRSAVVSGWTINSGVGRIIESPPYHNNKIFAGGKALVGYSQGVDYVSTMLLESGVTNRHLQFVLLPSFENGQLCYIQLQSGNSRWGVGINLIDSTHRHPMYISGSTVTNMTGIPLTSHCLFDIYQYAGTVTAYMNSQLLYSGSNNLNAFNDLHMRLPNSCIVDYINVSKITTLPPIVTLDASVDRRCLHFESVLQGLNKFAIQFKYLLQGWYVEAHSNLPITRYVALTNDAKVSEAYGGGVSSNTNLPYTYYILVQTDFNLPISFGKTVDALSKLCIEYQSTVVSDSNIWGGWLAYLFADSNLWADFKQSLIIDGQCPYDYLAVVDSFHKVIVEHLTRADSDFLLSEEYSNVIHAYSRLIFDFGNVIKCDGNIPIELKTQITTDINLVYSWLKDIVTDHNLSFDHAFLVYTFAKICYAYESRLEASAILPVDNFAIINTDLNIPFSVVSKIVHDSNLFYEWGNRILTDVNLVKEYGLLYHSFFSLVWASQQSIDSSIYIPFDMSMVAEAYANILYEYLQVFHNDSQLTPEVISTIASDAKIVSDWLGAVQSSDCGIPIDLTQIRAIFVNVCTEILGRLVNDNQTVPDILQTIVSDQNYPIENLGTIPVIIGSNFPVEIPGPVAVDASLGTDFILNLISDVRVTNEYLSLFISSFVNIGYELLSRMSIFANLTPDRLATIVNSTQLASEATSNLLVCDFKLPYEHSLLTDVTVGSQNLAIGWGMGVNVDVSLPELFIINIYADGKLAVMTETQIVSDVAYPIDYQQMFSAATNILTTWLTDTEFSARLSVGHVTDTEIGFMLAIDFGQGVQCVSQVTLEELIQVIGSTNIRIENGGGTLLALLIKNSLLRHPSLGNVSIRAPRLLNLMLRHGLLNSSMTGEDSSYPD